MYSKTHNFYLKDILCCILIGRGLEFSISLSYFINNFYINYPNALIVIVFIINVLEFSYKVYEGGKGIR